jgi:hypothetical protein
MEEPSQTITTPQGMSRQFFTGINYGVMAGIGFLTGFATAVILFSVALL